MDIVFLDEAQDHNVKSNIMSISKKMGQIKFDNNKIKVEPKRMKFTEKYLKI